MAERNFGNQTNGGVGVQAPPADHKAVCRFQNDSGAELLVSTLWFDWGAAVSASFRAKGVIYSDVASAPSVLLATSGEFVGSAPRVGFQFSSPVFVPSGGYVWAGLIANIMEIAGVCSSGGAIYYNANTYSSGPTATFGAPSVAPYTYRMFLVGEDGTESFGRRSIDITGIGAGDGNYQPNREHAERVRLGGSSSVLITSISTYIRNTEAGAKSKAAIYTAPPGSFNPGTLIAQTTEVTGTTANTWLDLPIPGGVMAAPGEYWLTFITDTNLTTPVIPMSGDLCVDGPVTEASAWPDPYDTGGAFLALRQSNASDTRGIDIYASYTAVPSGGSSATRFFLVM